MIITTFVIYAVLSLVARFKFHTPWSVWIIGVVLNGLIARYVPVLWYVSFGCWLVAYGVGFVAMTKALRQAS